MSPYHPPPIAKEELRDGDHVYSYRHWHLYSHHGIYVAKEQKVIHFDWRDHWCSDTGKDYNSCGKCEENPNRVRMNCVECFLRFKVIADSEGESNAEDTRPSLHRSEYGKSRWDKFCHDAGTCYTQSIDPAGTVVERAMDAYKQGTFKGPRTSRWRPWHNCESFAYYCKTGEFSSGAQFRRFALGAVVAAGTVAAVAAGPVPAVAGVAAVALAYKKRHNRRTARCSSSK